MLIFPKYVETDKKTSNIPNLRLSANTRIPVNFD